MSRDHSKLRRNDHHSLKNLPAEVLLKARSTLFSLGGALKHKHDHNKEKPPKQEKLKEKRTQERLKTSHSEPEFGEIRKKHRSRLDESNAREYNGAARQRPISVGGSKHFDNDLENFRCGSFPRDTSPVQKRSDSTEEICVQSRLYIPFAERLSNQDGQMQDGNERPRKKLSFREPEIIVSSDFCGVSTLGRSNKHMGVNSLTRRPNRTSIRNETFSSSIEGLESDLESQAMRIVRTVGQAFEVCHKMQVNSPGEPAQSTSSAVDEPAPSCSDAAISKEAASECGTSEAAAPAVKAEEPIAKEEPARPSQLDLLPPPPRKEGKRTRTIPTPTVNLPDLPECITKVEVIDEALDPTTPLSAQHQLQLLRERLDQEAQQTRAAVAQLLLLRDQLAAEQAARCEAQARTHQLLLHNKELLEHIGALVGHLQDRETNTGTSPRRPINAHQLTLLPQTEQLSCNGNLASTEELINLFSPNNNSKVENGTRSPFSVPASPGAAASLPSFDNISNDQIQDYLIAKFEEMGGFPNHPNKPTKTAFNADQQYFQNCQAFPNIPPLVSHYSNTDLQSLLNHSVYSDGKAQAMSVGRSDNSIFTPDPESDSSKDSSDSSSEEGIPFIKPLSHNGTLTATGEDGKVRLIVPVSPSESVSEVNDTVGALSGNTLAVPGNGGPITRSTSEKVPRSEMMAAMRQQWTRHTTK